MPVPLRSQIIRTSLFMNGNSEAVIIPQEFRLDCKQVAITRNEDGDLVLRPEPPSDQRGDALLEVLAGFDPDFIRALEEDRSVNRA